MMKQQNRRVWLIGGAAAAVALCAGSYFFLIGPELDATDQLHSQAASTQQYNDTLQIKIASLKRKSGQIGDDIAALRVALAALPVDSGLPAFTRQLTAQAAATGVTLSNVTVGGITLITGAAAASVPTGDSTDPAATSPSATPTPAPTPAAPTTAAGPQAPAAVGASAGTYAVQLTVNTAGSLANQLRFLKTVQYAGPRSALVTSTQLGAASSVSIDKATKLTAQLVVFSSPQSADRIRQLRKLLNGDLGS